MNSLSLGNKQKREKFFFNKVFTKSDYVNYYSMGFTNVIFEKMMEKIGNIEDRKLLDFGCGDGWLSEILSKKGAKVFAFDISKEAVAKLKSKSEGLNSKYQINVDQMAAEDLSYDSDTFDYVVGNAILHHTDLGKSIQEIHRVLKKGGRAYFMEPLGHNFFLNMYRKLTPNLRSCDEKPLVFNDFKYFRNLFKKFNHEEYYLTVLLALFWYLIIRNHRLLLKTRDQLVKLDRRVLHLFPSLKRYCWYSILIMEK